MPSLLHMSIQTQKFGRENSLMNLDESLNFLLKNLKNVKRGLDSRFTLGFNMRRIIRAEQVSVPPTAFAILNVSRATTNFGCDPIANFLGSELSANFFRTMAFVDRFFDDFGKKGFVFWETEIVEHHANT